MKAAFQGVYGAYSHLAASEVYPDSEYKECETFASVLDSVRTQVCDRAVIPVENSNAGRVADVHFLLPATGLFIVGEYFFRVHHQLWGLPDSELKNIKKAMSHPQALAQTSKYLSRHHIVPTASPDTALSCRLIGNLQDPTCAAVASEAAGQLYGLKKLAENIENSSNNTTRFLLMSRHPLDRGLYFGKKCKTSLIFKARNIHSALFQALKCFADEALNLTKIESYMCGDRFLSAQFYIELESSDLDPSFQRALAALEKVCESIHLLGTYPENAADVSFIR